MSQEHALLYGPIGPYLDGDLEVMPAFDEAGLRVALRAHGVDLGDGDEGLLELDTIIWQAELVRDEAGLIKVVAGDFYLDARFTAADVHSIHDTWWSLAQTLGAGLWLVAGDEEDSRQFDDALLRERITDLLDVARRRQA